jgi:uncharacterized protein
MMTFSGGQKLSIQMMAKPFGSGCNLDCRYCYYLEKEKLYSDVHAKRHMSEKMLDSFIAQTIHSFNDPVVSFTWHGGEPLLRGMEFFEAVIRIQKKYGMGRKIENSLQTNGTLLTDDWCRFFKEHNFLLGLSIDGPEFIHDHYRLYRSGKGSFANCMKGLELLVKHGVEFNTLSVVNDHNAKYPLEVYRFLKSIGSRYMQFLPVVVPIVPAHERSGPKPGSVESKESMGVSSWSVDPEDYGAFLIQIFDEWVRYDIGNYFVITFDCVLANKMGVPSPVCTSSEICGHAGVVEFNGDVYSCDHFVFPEYLLGNISQKSLLTLMNDPAQKRFGRDKRDKLPGYCRRCEFLSLCNGECPKNRILHSPDGEPGLNYLCRGFRKFYKHSEIYFDFMANELRNNRPPSNVSQWALKRK